MAEWQTNPVILLTKVRVPRRRPDILRRARLLEALHQNIHRKLIFITAPAGFGKTTLLVDFASEAPGRVCWYHITAEDRDLGRFVRYLAWSLRQAYPELGGPLRDLLEGRLPTQSIPALAGWLSNVLAEHVDDFTILVLDDYHLVGEELGIVDFVEAFLEHLPEQVHLLVASRSVYGIPTTRLLLRNELGVLGPDDLRFTAEELQHLAKMTYDVTLPTDYAQDLARRTDGWVIAMLLAVRLRTEGRLPVIRGEREELYRFLAEEVLHYLPARLVHFLLATSIFDEFDEPLCREVLEEPEAGAYLQEIEARNLFVVRVDAPQGVVYRYHQLFAEFLRAQLSQEDPQRVRELHRRAAEWYWTHGAPAEAVAHMLAAGDREAAARWMDESALVMFVTGRSEILRQWVEALAQPIDWRDRAPRLLLYQAKTLSNANRFTESDALLDMARPVLERRRDEIALANVLETRGFNAYMQGQYTLAKELAHAALVHLKPLPLTSEVRLRLAHVRRIEALALSQLGEMARAIERLEEVISELEGLRQEQPEALFTKDVLYNQALTLQDLGVCYYQQGRLGDALHAFERVRDIWQEARLSPIELPAVLNNLAFLYHRTGRYEQALQTYLRAAELARQHRAPALALILAGLADLYYEEERWELAESHLREAVETARGAGLRDFLAKVYLGLAKLYAARGQFAEAMNFLRQVAKAENLSETALKFRWYQGYLFWLLGLEREALRLLQNLTPQDLEDQVRRDLIVAALSLIEGEEVRAQKTLDEALGKLTRLGYVHFLRIEARRLRAFLHQAAAAHSHPILQDLLALASVSVQVVAKVRERAAPQWPALRVQGFGPGKVWLDERMVPKSAWRASGARALFFYILDQGPVRKEDLTLAFWPDFSPAQVNSNLHATLWRVRKALGNKAFVQAEEGVYRLHPDLSIKYDVHWFERLINQAQQTVHSEERRALWRQAAELYQGDFLQDLDFPWIEERRYVLQRRYREMLDGLIEEALGRKDYREAMRWLEQALALDPYNDRWHLRWMQCLVATGARSSARAYYRDYQQRLQRELGVEPDEPLRRFAEEL